MDLVEHVTDLKMMIVHLVKKINISTKENVSPHVQKDITVMKMKKLARDVITHVIIALMKRNVLNVLTGITYMEINV
jgi:hypothetical protein